MLDEREPAQHFGQDIVRHEENSHKLSRRKFLKGAAIAGGAAAFLGYYGWLTYQQEEEWQQHVGSTYPRPTPTPIKTPTLKTPAIPHFEDKMSCAPYGILDFFRMSDGAKVVAEERLHDLKDLIIREHFNFGGALRDLIPIGAARILRYDDLLKVPHRDQMLRDSRPYYTVTRYEFGFSDQQSSLESWFLVNTLYSDCYNPEAFQMRGHLGTIPNRQIPVGGLAKVAQNYFVFSQNAIWEFGVVDVPGLNPEAVVVKDGQVEFLLDEYKNILLVSHLQ